MDDKEAHSKGVAHKHGKQANALSNLLLLKPLSGFSPDEMKVLFSKHFSQAESKVSCVSQS